MAVPEDHFLNVSGFEAWLPRVSGGGAAYVQRATAWVNLFRYHRQTQVVSNLTAALASATKTSIHDKASATEIGVPMAEAVRDAYTEMMTLLLQFTTTPGELGMLAAHGGANWPSKFGAVVNALSAYLDNATMQSLQPPMTYAGPPRVFRNAVRTVLSASLDLEFKLAATVLAAAPPKAVTLVIESGASYPMTPQGSTKEAQVYGVSIPTPADDFSYHVEVTLADASALRDPPDAAQSVVVVP